MEAKPINQQKMSTEKKIINYLHFYLGCQVEYEGILNGKELKAEKEANKDDIFYMPQVQEQKGKKIGYLREVCYTQNDGYSRCKVGRKSLKSFWGINPDIKLILRPLSSMTVAEMQECGNMEYDFSDDPDLNKWEPKDFEIGLSPRQFAWLISKHFDLFDLIPEGLALDKSTLKQPG
jgi:hypothetical protein